MPEGVSRPLACVDASFHCRPTLPRYLGTTYRTRIKAIFFGFSIRGAALIGFDDRFIYEQFSRPAEKRTIRQEQVLKNEALHLAENFASNPNCVQY